MNDAEIRVRCIEAAAQVPGNPNTLQQARAFYAFVVEEVAVDAGTIAEPTEELPASQQLRVKPKGAKK